MGRKVTVGQTLYSLNVGNRARDRKQVLTPVTVMTIGRKYFTVVETRWIKNKHMQTQYYLDDWVEKSDYSSNSVLYETEQEWFDRKETKEICRYISDAFTYAGNCKSVSIDRLRKIRDLIEDNHG